MRDELFLAERGRGATLNGKPISVGPAKAIDELFVATELAAMRGSEPNLECLTLLSNVIKKSQGLSRLGSSALDLAYVACGRFDLFYEEGLATWDTVAGAVILREAGGAIIDLDGSATSWFEMGNVIAGNSQNVVLFQAGFFDERKKGQGQG